MLRRRIFNWSLRQRIPVPERFEDRRNTDCLQHDIWTGPWSISFIATVHAHVEYSLTLRGKSYISSHSEAREISIPLGRTFLMLNFKCSFSSLDHWMRYFCLIQWIWSSLNSSPIKYRGIWVVQKNHTPLVATLLFCLGLCYLLRDSKC